MVFSFSFSFFFVSFVSICFRSFLFRFFNKKDRIPCAAHRPPHRKKRNIVTVNAKIIVTASKKALGNKAQGAAKTIGKRDPGTRQNPLKWRPGGVLGTKILPSGGPDQPRGAQERPSRSQELAQGCPRGAKNHPKAPQSQPRGTKECPRPLYNQVQRASRPGSSAIFVGSFVRQAPGAIFYCFFVLCVTCTICENHRKTYVFPRFLRIGS